MVVTICAMTRSVRAWLSHVRCRTVVSITIVRMLVALVRGICLAASGSVRRCGPAPCPGTSCGGEVSIKSNVMNVRAWLQGTGGMARARESVPTTTCEVFELFGVVLMRQ